MGNPSRIHPPQCCDAHGCDKPVVVMLSVRNIDTDNSEDEFWCWDHEDTRTEQVENHSRLVVDNVERFDWGEPLPGEEVTK